MFLRAISTQQIHCLCQLKGNRSGFLPVITISVRMALHCGTIPVCGCVWKHLSFYKKQHNVGHMISFTHGNKKRPQAPSVICNDNSVHFLKLARIRPKLWPGYLVPLQKRECRTPWRLSWDASNPLICTHRVAQAPTQPSIQPGCLSFRIDNSFSWSKRFFLPGRRENPPGLWPLRTRSQAIALFCQSSFADAFTAVPRSRMQKPRPLLIHDQSQASETRGKSSAGLMH